MCQGSRMRVGCSNCFLLIGDRYMTMVPTGTGKQERHFPVKEKSKEFCSDWKNTGKVWKMIKLINCKHMRMFIDLARHTCPHIYTFKCHFYQQSSTPWSICENVKIKTWILVSKGYIKCEEKFAFKKYWKMGKTVEKSGNFVSP